MIALHSYRPQSAVWLYPLVKSADWGLRLTDGVVRAAEDKEPFPDTGEGREGPGGRGIARRISAFRPCGWARIERVEIIQILAAWGSEEKLEDITNLTK